MANPTANDFNLLIVQHNLRQDAMQVLMKTREVYAQMNIVHDMVVRFGSEPTFQDAFDEVMYYLGGDLDMSFAISQMFYDINTLRSAWLADANKKAVLGIT